MAWKETNAIVIKVFKLIYPFEFFFSNSLMKFDKPMQSIWDEIHQHWQQDDGDIWYILLVKQT